MEYKNVDVPRLLRILYLYVISVFIATERASDKKETATIKSVEIEEQSKTIAVEKGEAEEALAEALPVLEIARLALSELDKGDITEIR